MKALHFLQITTLFTIVLLTSCKKVDDGLPSTTKNITLLNTNYWKVVAQHVQPKPQGNLGGSFETQAFNLQSPNKLRWYLWFKHIAGYEDPIEIILNNQNININLSDSNATIIKRLQVSEDGLLNNSEGTGTNTVSHYHYGTGQWKTTCCDYLQTRKSKQLA